MKQQRGTRSLTWLMNEIRTANERVRWIYRLPHSDRVLRGAKSFRIGKHLARATSFAILTPVFLLLLASSAFASEDAFDTLQVGSCTYKNVTVTTKAKNHIFITHSRGMASIKVSELPGDVLEKLGYASAAVPKAQTKVAAVWARNAMAKIDASQLKRAEATLAQAWQATKLSTNLQVPVINSRVIAIAAMILLLMYLFHGYCCMRICQKAGKQPGVLVWLPFLQWVPMLRAASMSAWWSIAFFIPVLNLVAYFVWSAKIIEARHKTTPLMVLLLLPITNIFAFVYLALSEPASQRRPDPTAGIMTLQTA